MAFGSRRHPCRLASVWVVLSGVCVGVCAGVFEEDCSLKKQKILDPKSPQQNNKAEKKRPVGLSIQNTVRLTLATDSSETAYTSHLTPERSPRTH